MQDEPEELAQRLVRAATWYVRERALWLIVAYMLTFVSIAVGIVLYLQCWNVVTSLQ